MNLECKFRCQSCHKEFSTEKPGPTKCLWCGSSYIDWLNFEQIMREIDENSL